MFAPPGILLPSEPATSFLQFPRYRSQKYRQPYPIGKVEARRQYKISNACYEACEPTILDGVSLSLRVRMECTSSAQCRDMGKQGFFSSEMIGTSKDTLAICSNSRSGQWRLRWSTYKEKLQWEILYSVCRIYLFTARRPCL